MTTMDKEFWNDRDDSFENSNSQVADSRLAPGEYNLDTDEDDQNLSDDDRKGRDLDVDGRDEWDAGNVSGKDLDEDDLEDNDEANAELHQVKNDQFGSLGRSVTNEAAPDPDEIPEEHELGNEEVDFPDGDDTLEQGERNEVNYKEPTEVNPPEPREAPERKAATLGDLDSTFTDDNHSRSTGRTIDHEPGGGSTPPEHGAYNL
jgi:hypothetical protein